MRKIYLVKHASPLVHPGIPTDRWPLSEKGRAAATELADSLAHCGATSVITSSEPKAHQTGQILADRLNIPITQADNLHEHQRRTVPHLRTADFISAMAQVFRHKDQLVLGEETAGAALARFRTALDQVLQQQPTGDLIIVAHGTVIALLVESLSDRNGYQLWREMGLPSYVVLSDSPLVLVDGPFPTNPA